MNQHTIRPWLPLLAVFVVAATCSGGPAGGRQKDKPLPPFEQIEQTVWRHFEVDPEYRPGDIITRSQVAPLFTLFKRMGFKPADGKRILGKVSPDGSFLVRHLLGGGWRKFMRRIASYPNAYDRLDRLARLPHGKQTIRDLIRGPGGDEMIEYMTTSKGGKNLGKLLENAPKGKNFNRPTGRIYTAEMLVQALKKSYQEEMTKHE